MEKEYKFYEYDIVIYDFSSAMRKLFAKKRKTITITN